MVSFLGFFEKLDVRFQLFCGREADTVNSLQHFVLGIALPVSTGMSDELEVAAKLYIIYMRSAAEVGKIALLIAGDVTVFQTVD